MQIRWLIAAKADLDAEVTHIAQEDQELAVKVYASIRNQVAGLSLFPEKGKPGRVFGTRELVIQQYSYIIPYRVKDGVVEILSVFHTKRKLPETW